MSRDQIEAHTQNLFSMSMHSTKPNNHNELFHFQIICIKYSNCIVNNPPQRQQANQSPINNDIRAGKGLSAFFTVNKHWGSGNHNNYGYGYGNYGHSSAPGNLNANLNQNYNVNYNTFNDDINGSVGAAKPPVRLSDPISSHPSYPSYYGHHYSPQHGGTSATGYLFIGPFRKLHSLGISLLGGGHLYGTGQFFRARDYSDASKK